MNTQLKKNYHSLPKELKTKINMYHIDKTNYRFIMMHLLDSIKFKGCIMRIRHLERIFYSQKFLVDNTSVRNIVFTDILKKYVDDPDYLISVLSECKCCLRHAKRRPKKIFNYMDNLDVFENLNHNRDWTKLDCSSSCRCQCRHISRLLVYAFGDKEYNYHADNYCFGINDNNYN